MKTDKIIEFKNCYEVNNKYAIYKDDGCIYNQYSDADIPQKYFKIRDRLLPALARNSA